MGCFQSRSLPQESPRAVARRRSSADVRFRGFQVTKEYERRALAFLDRMDTRRLSYLTRRGLLLCFARNMTWRIYLHFTDWPQPVTATFVDRLIAQFRRAAAMWLQNLAGFDGFPSATLQVKVFGFVFHKGVIVDPSFEAKYRRYPVVRGWTQDGEACPWELELAGGRKFFPQNFYRPDLQLCDIRVVGNRTGTGATYYPESWTSYEHPEGIDGFETRYWHGADGWNATAQQHYLRVSGVIREQNYSTGDFADLFYVLQHEMGHCFFLDDMYDTKKYPRRLSTCDCSLEPGDTVMHGAKGLTPLDHAMLRHVWRCQRRLAEMA